MTSSLSSTTPAPDTRSDTGRDPLAERGPFRRLIVLTLAYVALVSAVFLAFPGLDLWMSGLFHDPTAGFWATTDPLLMRLRELGPFLVKVIAGASLAILLAATVAPRLVAGLSLRAPLFLLSTLALGPGLLVNAILKNNWGRPRPNSVEAFGGDAPFIGVWRITDHCATNCSFVSGEGSASFWLVALAFLAPPAWRRGILLAVAPLFLALSLNRVAFGGHFLSDTMLAWGLTLLVILAVYAGLYRTAAGERIEARTRAGLAAFGAYTGALLTRAGRGLATRIDGFFAMFR